MRGPMFIKLRVRGQEGCGLLAQHEAGRLPVRAALGSPSPYSTSWGGVRMTRSQENVSLVLKPHTCSRDTMSCPQHLIL